MRAAVRAAMEREWLVRRLARKRSAGRDAALDRQMAAALELQRISRLPALESMEPAAARQFAADGLAALDLDPAAIDQVTDVRAGGSPVRLYVPRGAGPHWIVYFHGGGGVIGSIESSEPFTRHLAASTRCTVASVEYRLGPEHRHPAAIDDAYAAYAALCERVPAGGRVAVAGDSFGGYLSIRVEHRARTRGARRPDVQAPIYPVVDFTLTSRSIEDLAEGYMLTRELIHWFRGHYLGPNDDPRAQSVSPWFWPDAELSGAAPALVITAAFDPLVDDGDGWAKRLVAAGVAVRHRREPALVHGFVSMAGAIRAARDAVDRICADLVEMLG